MTFEDFPLPDFLQDDILYKGWEVPTPIQH